ncbi:hypothetical protein H1C71_037715 [Ictidomys tridecemlineatus]|nr:hypothetical protein H1C71_037715 [Ictidomys tridecemlineatus]
MHILSTGTHWLHSLPTSLQQGLPYPSLKFSLASQANSLWCLLPLPCHNQDFTKCFLASSTQAHHLSEGLEAWGLPTQCLLFLHSDQITLFQGPSPCSRDLCLLLFPENPDENSLTSLGSEVPSSRKPSRED